MQAYSNELGECSCCMAWITALQQQELTATLLPKKTSALQLLQCRVLLLTAVASQDVLSALFRCGCSTCYMFCSLLEIYYVISQRGKQYILIY